MYYNQKSYTHDEVIKLLTILEQNIRDLIQDRASNVELLNELHNMKEEFIIGTPYKEVY
jgi:hypothetical protein